MSPLTLWRFHRQSQVLTRRYRTAAYPGRTLVVLAENEDKDLRARWGPHLRGHCELHTTRGDHIWSLPLVTSSRASRPARGLACQEKRHRAGRRSAPEGL